MSEINKKVYEALQDDISRILYKARLEAFETSGKSISISDVIEANINKYVGNDKDKKIALYGAGIIGDYLLLYLTNAGFSVECFCDSSPGKWGGMFKGLPVISPDALFKQQNEYVVLISSLNYYDEIFDYLVKRKFPLNQIVEPEWATSKWPRSKALQYFGEDFLKPVKNEVFVDTGAYSGDTVEKFIQFSTGKYRKIYALEPDKRNFAGLNKNLSSCTGLVALNKGAWNTNETLSFREDAYTFGSNITNAGDSSIETTKIDDIFCDNDSATFIKMDIEGAELQALMGAENTIKKHKPRLAISIYHKLDDIVTIPEYILSVVPEYKLYIRHYSAMPQETVLYAI